MNSIEKAVKRLMSGSGPGDKNDAVGEVSSQEQNTSYDPQLSSDKVLCHIDLKKLKENSTEP